MVILFFGTCKARVNFSSSLRNPYAKISNLCQCDISNVVPAIGISETGCWISDLKFCYLHITLLGYHLPHATLIYSTIFSLQIIYLEWVTIKSVNL